MATVLSILLGPDRDRAGDYLRWKHMEFPSGEDPILLAVTHDGGREVVGMNGFLPMTWSDGSGGKSTRLACWADFIIHPEHQRKGLGRLLLSETTKVLRERGFSAAISFSQNPISTKLSLGLGWRAVGLATCARLVSPGSIPGSSVALGGRNSVVARGLRFAMRRFGRSSASVFEKFDRRKTARPTESATKPRVEAMALLAATTGAKGRLRLQRTKEYFAWRFKNPIARYRFLYLSQNDQLQGFLILQEFLTRARGRTVVLDLTAGNAEVAVELLRSAQVQGGFGNMYMLAECIQPEVRKYLMTVGFELDGPRNQVPSLIIKPLDTATGGLSNRVLSSLNSWHFQFIDSDAF